MSCSPKRCSGCKNIFKACQLHQGKCSKCRNNGEEVCHYTPEIIVYHLNKLKCVKENNKDIGISSLELDNLITTLTAASTQPCKYTNSIKEAQALLPIITQQGC